MEPKSGLMNASDVQQWNKFNFPQYGEDTAEELREWVLLPAALQLTLPVHAALLLLHAVQQRGGGGGGAQQLAVSRGAETLQQPAGAQPRPPAAGRHGQTRARGRGRAAGDRYTDTQEARQKEVSLVMEQSCQRFETRKGEYGHLVLFPLVFRTQM